MSPSIDFKITRETEDESKDIAVTVHYEGNSIEGIRAYPHATAVDGSIIVLTEAERDLATDKAWDDWGGEQFA